jgi:Acetoacetate decarboxylase (ADC)
LIPHELPDYVDRGGRQVWRPPYAAQGAEVFGFVLPCDPAAIDTLLRHDLVEPSGGAVDYRCAQPRIAVLFAAIDRLTSGDNRDSLRGYVSELEVSVWCLAADATAGGRLLWYLPYVFVDNGQAVASGREVYGYPKQMGSFEPGFPTVLAAGGQTTVSALAIDPYGPNSGAVLSPMISAAAAATAVPVGEDFGELVDRFGPGVGVDESLPFGAVPQSSAAITPAGSPPPRPRRPGPPVWAVRRVLDTIRGRALPDDTTGLVADMVANPTLLFLKQFRDVACPTKACYQAIVEAPLSVEPMSADYLELDPDHFEITIEDYDSHPIAADVGVVAGTPLTPEAAFLAAFDFDIQLGLEVWRAPT